MKNTFYNAVHSLFHNPAHFCAAVLYRINPIFNDATYLKLMYRLEVGKNLNINNPQTFNEKLQWLKLNYHNPDWTRMADKLLAKEVVSKKIGNDYIIPTLGVWYRPEDIDWDSLPSQFVLKTNHDSGNSGVIVCKDKSVFDKTRAIQLLKKSLRKNSYLPGREWPYKNIERKIFAEVYLEDSSTNDLPDYKFYCFDGRVELLFVATERQIPGEVAKFDYFDANFKPINLKMVHPKSKHLIEKPRGFEMMRDLAAKLSEGIPAVRMDMYDVNGKIYFGEFTFFPSGGMAPFHPDDWDYKLGELIKLPKVML